MSITKRNDVFINQAKGLGSTTIILAGPGAGSATANSAGFFTLTPLLNNIGTTYPSTWVSLVENSGLSSQLYTAYMPCSSSSLRGFIAAIVYKLGTLDLSNAATAPYDGFTHNANFTGPIKRTMMGQTTNIQLMPLVYVTTAATTTAPAFILQTTSGPSTGYTNQSNSSVTGTKTFTFPSATTGTQWGGLLRLEDGDSAILDITQISVTTKDAACKATVYGIEPLFSTPIVQNHVNALYDGMFGPLQLMDITPGTPTTGTITLNTDAWFALIGVVGGNGGTEQNCGLLYSVLNS